MSDDYGDGGVSDGAAATGLDTAAGDGASCEMPPDGQSDVADDPSADLFDPSGAPDLREFVTESGDAGEEIGEMVGVAAFNAMGEQIGVGEALGEHLGKELGGAVGGTMGAALGVGAYAIAEMDHLWNEFDGWASAKGGVDPHGATLPPGGAPDDNAPDAGTGTGAAEYLGEADDPGFAPDKATR